MRKEIKTNNKGLWILLYLLVTGIVLSVLWFNLEWISSALVDLLPVTRGSRLHGSIRFFMLDFPKVMILLVAVVFFIGLLRSYFSPERTRKFLEGKPLFIGNILASLLGVLTPFCSCSAVPLFLGFVEAGVPLGVTFSFLVAAPMINEVALVLLFALFGAKTALLYASTGLAVAILSGYVIGRLKLEHYVEDWVYSISAQENQQDARMNFYERIRVGIDSVRDIVSKVWKYIFLGLVVGAIIHGYVPENMMASIMGKGSWYSVPIAVLVGIPMYSNAAGILPIVQVLIEKGASLGTALAFMMSVIGLSLPEMIILRKVLKIPLIVIFSSVVAVGIMIVGFVFNAIF